MGGAAGPYTWPRAVFGTKPGLAETAGISSKLVRSESAVAKDKPRRLAQACEAHRTQWPRGSGEAASRRASFPSRLPGRPLGF